MLFKDKYNEYAISIIFNQDMRYFRRYHTYQELKDIVNKIMDDKYYDDIYIDYNHWNGTYSGYYYQDLEPMTYDQAKDMVSSLKIIKGSNKIKYLSSIDIVKFDNIFSDKHDSVYWRSRYIMYNKENNKFTKLLSLDKVAEHFYQYNINFSDFANREISKYIVFNVREDNVKYYIVGAYNSLDKGLFIVPRNYLPYKNKCNIDYNDHYNYKCINLNINDTIFYNKREHSDYCTTIVPKIIRDDILPKVSNDIDRLLKVYNIVKRELPIYGASEYYELKSYVESGKAKGSDDRHSRTHYLLKLSLPISCNESYQWYTSTKDKILSHKYLSQINKIYLINKLEVLYELLSDSKYFDNNKDKIKSEMSKFDDSYNDLLLNQFIDDDNRSLYKSLVNSDH